MLKRARPEPRIPTPVGPAQLSFRLRVVIFYAANTQHARLDVDEIARKFGILPSGVKYKVKPLVVAGLLRPIRRKTRQGRRWVEYAAGDALLRELGEIE